MVLSSNDTNPLIFGSITRNIVSQMIDVDVFSIFLDSNEMKRDFGEDKKDAVMSNLLQKANSVQSQFGAQLGNIKREDWLNRFYDNLPFPKEEILICNLPMDDLGKRVLRGETLKLLDERNQRENEARTDIFVYAGFIQPGKHQILIKDKLTNNLYAREIVVDIRRREIESHAAPNQEKRTIGIRKY